MMKFERIVDFAARTKQYVLYGVGLLYPGFTLVTFLGVAKLAFSIPPELAAIVAFGGVYIVGITAFRIGLYSRDMNITWKNTPMAVDIHERTDRIEKAIERIEKRLNDNNK
jgi:uncharacterized membrane protein (GlpM family)